MTELRDNSAINFKRREKQYSGQATLPVPREAIAVTKQTVNVLNPALNAFPEVIAARYDTSTCLPTLSSPSNKKSISL